MWLGPRIYTAAAEWRRAAAGEAWLGLGLGLGLGSRVRVAG